ncbi:HTH-type transcriptional regulator YodB [Paraliobacillus ryukyuensis]|uniref:HxlR family transcriptional regulator n=1 Tax=Paraliobacillus ryukyuensis TaxID=200904 RepID=A0A366EDM2_9BACI|nr:helix-turn-helix domain-containing protein [Paraliobacillus ryukyuensis]RBP00482.1 HxlR family transcriptional regulator [Paraliobacillus ryukyuensis]
MEQLCPRFEKAMQLFGKRWVGLILYELLNDAKRFSEIEAALPISGRLLSERLKMLEQEGMVERKVYSEFPVRIEYVLTEKGAALQPAIQNIRQWSEHWITQEEVDETIANKE